MHSVVFWKTWRAKQVFKALIRFAQYKHSIRHSKREKKLSVASKQESSIKPSFQYFISSRKDYSDPILHHDLNKLQQNRQNTFSSHLTQPRPLLKALQNFDDFHILSQLRYRSNHYETEVKSNSDKVFQLKNINEDYLQLVRASPRPFKNITLQSKKVDGEGSDLLTVLMEMNEKSSRLSHQQQLALDIIRFVVEIKSKISNSIIL
jgi:hypothetical protein